MAHGREQVDEPLLVSRPRPVLHRMTRVLLCRPLGQRRRTARRWNPEVFRRLPPRAPLEHQNPLAARGKLAYRHGRPESGPNHDRVVSRHVAPPVLMPSRAGLVERSGSPISIGRVKTWLTEGDQPDERGGGNERGLWGLDLALHTTASAAAAGAVAGAAIVI